MDVVGSGTYRVFMFVVILFGPDLSDLAYTRLDLTHTRLDLTH
jgi:hypothetical protein